MASTGESVPADSESKSTGLLSAENLDSLGAQVKDLLPIPSDTQPVTDPGQTEISHSLADETTLSHALATDDHEVKGLAQQDHAEEVLDLGWNQQKQEIAAPLVGGLDNEELWMLTRRFDKVREASSTITIKFYVLLTNFAANVPRQGNPKHSAWWSGSQHRGRGGVLS